MVNTDIRLLSIAPYCFLPLRNGGHQAIAKLHHYLGQQCHDDVVGTADNADNPFAFHLHKIFPPGRTRYLQYPTMSKVLQLAQEQNSTHLICEHPYMAVTAMSVSKKLGLPWFLRSHNIESERYRAFGKPFWPGLRLYERYAMQQSSGVYFIAPEDKQWAIDNFKLPVHKCHDVPFGTDMQAIPAGHDEAKQQLAGELGISADVPWLYFLGALDYSPNAAAVGYILDEIQPRLNKYGKPYEILIAGKGLDDELQQRIKATAHIQYNGFVNDLDIFLKGCDVMLNPVLKGGGVKTKAIEALGYNKKVISSASGAAGIDSLVCGHQLKISADFAWDNFVADIMDGIKNNTTIPAGFYEKYYHGNIATRVIDILGNTKY